MDNIKKYNSMIDEKEAQRGRTARIHSTGWGRSIIVFGNSESAEYGWVFAEVLKEMEPEIIRKVYERYDDKIETYRKAALEDAINTMKVLNDISPVSDKDLRDLIV